jgi:hypothetical protein
MKCYEGHEVMWKWILEIMYSTFLARWFLPHWTSCMVSFHLYFAARCKCPVCTVVGWIVFLVVTFLCLWLSYVYVCSSYVYLLYWLYWCFTLDAGLLASSQYTEGPVTGHIGTGVLGFPVSKSKCWDGCQESKLPLHASHVALPK